MDAQRSVVPITADAVHLPFNEQPADAAFRWRLGVRRLDPAEWFEWGETGDAAVAAKAEVMAAHADVAFAVLDDRVAEEAAELAEMIVDHLADHHPRRHRHLDPTLHPLDAAARLVPDDLALLVERDGRLVFGGGSICFPNEWDLASKLGLTLAEVHEPVDLLNEQIERPIDRFFERLSPERSWWRLGWGIIDTDDWFTPPGRDHPATNDPARWFLRVERESLRRLPVSGAVAFGIRTHLTPLDDLDDATAAQLAARIGRLPQEVVEYKSLDGVREQLIETLVR
ncbi:MAG: DUF3445 domain-containing protein [Actinomycetota bacterium]